MSDRVTAEQVQTCLDIVDVFSIEHYEQRVKLDEQSDKECTDYSFDIPTVRIPPFVLSRLISPPFSGTAYDNIFAINVRRMTAMSNAHLTHGEALVVTLLRRFQNQEMRGTTELHCALDFADTEGNVATRIDADITAYTRNHETERHARAADMLRYYSQLDVRLEAAGLAPSQRTPERAEAEAYIQNVEVNAKEMPKSLPVDLMPFLGSEEKHLLHKGATMTGSDAEALCTFLGSLSIRDRHKTGYEALAERFGTDREL